jgi:hypothetical protein
MKMLRIPVSLTAFLLVAALAACGGGGGGGSTTPPVNNPGGGGGGGNPTPTPTASPTPTPTPTPSGPTVVQSNGHFTEVYDGTSTALVFGTDNWQKGGLSDPEGPGDGDVSGGFAAGGTPPFNGVACTMNQEGMVSGKFHVHSFVGIYVNGTQYALPDAIGLQSPSGDSPVPAGHSPNDSFANACYIHTHAASGIVHIEDPTIASTSFAQQPPQYNLQSLLDVWGYGSIANIASAAAGFSGPVSIYVGTPCANNTVGCSTPNKQNGVDAVTSYTLQTGDPNSILLGHHVAVWIVVGDLPAAGLPTIGFGIST